MSDGAHNFDLVNMSLYHPASFDFREYSDKMASYLCPTFLNQMQKGNQ